MKLTVDIAAVKSEIERMFQSFSIEILPSESAKIDDYRDHLPKGTRVFIGLIPDVAPSDVVAVAKKLRDQEMVPVPHIPARRIKDLDMLDRYIRDLEILDVKQLLSIGGDPNPPEGAFESTLDVLKTKVYEKHNISEVGIAFHPEGHPAVDANIISESINQKLSYCYKNSLNPFLISQFIVSADPLISWYENSSHDKSKDTPIRAGLPGLVSPTKLYKFAKQCGVKASIIGLMKHTKTMKKLVSVSTPNHTILDMAAYNVKVDKKVFDSIHILPFGTFTRSAQWARGMVDGNFQIHELTEEPNLQLVSHSSYKK